MPTNGDRPHARHLRGAEEEQPLDLKALAEAADPIVRNFLENQRASQRALLEFADRRLGLEASFRQRVLWVIAAFGSGLLALTGYLFVAERDSTAFALLDGCVKFLGGVGIGSAFLRPRREMGPGEGPR